MKKCIFALPLFFLAFNLHAADLSKILHNVNVKGVELIVSQVDESRVSSAGGHAFLRIVTENYFDDIGVSFAPLLVDEINWSSLPHLLTGKYPNLMSVDRFTTMWKKSIQFEKRDLERYPLNLNREQIKNLLQVLLHWQKNPSKIGDYKLLTNNCVVLLHLLLFESGIVSDQNGPITPNDFKSFLYKHSLSVFPSSIISAHKSLHQIIKQVLNVNPDELDEISTWPSDSEQRINAYLHSLKNESEREFFAKKFLYLFSVMPLDMRKNLSSRYNYKKYSKISFEDLFSLSSILRLDPINSLDSSALIKYISSLNKEQELEYFLLYHKYKNYYSTHLAQLAAYFENKIEVQSLRFFVSPETKKFKLFTNSEQQVYLGFCQKQTCKRIEKRLSLKITATVLDHKSNSLFGSEVLRLKDGLVYIRSLENSHFQVFQVSYKN